MADDDFSLTREVKGRKDQSFKIRCESAIKSCGLSNKQFYEKVGISRQAWYFYSWGIEPFPDHLKIKLCDMFGKQFRDLFLTNLEVKQ